MSGPGKEYTVPLPNLNDEKKAILETYTKEHSAEYQSQALIDLARRMKERIDNILKIKSIEIHTSHHTHFVIGTGAKDPQKMDPKASRETLDLSKGLLPLGCASATDISSSIFVLSFILIITLPPKHFLLGSGS